MNNRLFWTGLIFQILQCGILGIVFLTVFLLDINWDFLTQKFLFIMTIVIINIASLFMIVFGLIQK